MRAGAALLAVFALGIAASALEAASIASPYSVPSEPESGATVSLWGVFVQLLVAILEIFGIELDPTSIGSPALSPVSIASLITALYPGVLIAIGIVLAVAAGLVAGRRLPTNAVTSIVTGVSNGHWWTSRTDGTESASEPWPPATPTDDVFREWVALTEDVPVTRPTTRTPAEWADAAIDAGYDPVYVDSVTQRFRAARYGDGEDGSSRGLRRSPTGGALGDCDDRCSDTTDEVDR